MYCYPRRGKTISLFEGNYNIKSHEQAGKTCPHSGSLQVKLWTNIER